MLNRRKIMIWLPVLLCVVTIFFLSSQPYEVQSLRPVLNEQLNEKWVYTNLSNVKVDYAGREISLDYLTPAAFIEFFIRKSAHFGIFFLLGWLLIRTLTKANVNRTKSFLISIVLISIFAATDEFHQSITPNRTPMVSDVLLDIFGGLSGITIAILYYYKIFNRNGAET